MEGGASHSWDAAATNYAHAATPQLTLHAIIARDDIPDLMPRRPRRSGDAQIPSIRSRAEPELARL
jgi:hypothetical protein